MERIKSYHLNWSTSTIFQIQFVTIMSHNRFECLIKMLHFSDNTCVDLLNRLYKSGNVINDIMANSNLCMQPKHNLCIDESLIKFEGRLAFKQYSKNKKDDLESKNLNYVFHLVILLL